jgi:hypothetical protein
LYNGAILFNSISGVVICGGDKLKFGKLIDKFICGAIMFGGFMLLLKFGIGTSILLITGVGKMLTTVSFSTFPKPFFAVNL